MSFQDTLVSPFTTSRQLESWSAGIAVNFATERLDWLAVSAHWRHEERPNTPYYYSSNDMGKNSFELGTVAFSLSQNLWGELWGQAGIAVLYQEAVSESVSRSVRDESFYRNKQEAIGGNFGWGVSYAWRFFAVHAAVRENFSLGDLFVSLDLAVHP